ncbi:MAG: DivIVA domain-containing protein [Acidimicrobiales bacterium]
MAIGVSPQRLREVRFAEQWRGYRTDEVDEFVERVAEAFDQLEERLSEAAERAARAERRLLERSPSDDLTRTLVLAQRTADTALAEAESTSARLVADAEERARASLAEAEARVTRFDAEVERRAESELGELLERRRSLESDVAQLSAYVERQRGRLAEELQAHLRWLQEGVHLEPVPEISIQPAPAIDRPGVGAEPAAEDPPPAIEADPSAEQRRGVDDGVFGALPTDGGVFGEELPEEQAPLLEDDTVLEDGTVLGDDTVLDDLGTEGIRWGEEGGDLPDGGDVSDDGDADEVPEPVATADDPYMAELRRAVDDPEPLGPRDAEEWPHDTSVFDDSAPGTARFRRRRRQR